MSSKTIASVALLALISLSGAAFGYPDAHQGSITVGGSPVAVAVSNDDRWVFVASNAGLAGEFYVIDTLTWTVVGSTLSLTTGNPIDMAVSVDGTYIYITDNNGYLTQITLPASTTYQIGVRPTLTSRTCLVDASGESLGAVAVGPMPTYEESSVNQYVIVGVPNGGVAPSIKVFEQTDLLTVAANCNATNSFSTGGDTPAGIIAGRAPADTTSPYDYFAHILFDKDTPTSDTYVPFPFTATVLPAEKSFADDLILGKITINSTDDRLFISAWDGTNETIWSASYIAGWGVPINEIPALFAEDRDVSLAVSGDPDDVEMLYVIGSNADGSLSDLIIYNTSTFTADPAIDFSATTTQLDDIAASTADDGFVYIASSDGSVEVISENPWFTPGSLAFAPTENDGNSDTLVTVEVNSTGTLYVFRDGDIHGIGGTQLDAITVTSSPVSFYLTPSDLIEGDNDIIVFLDDGATPPNVGRIGAVYMKDTVPPAPEFSVGFGDSTIYVNLSTLCDSDIDYYEIYIDANYDNVYPTPSADPYILDSFTACTTKKITFDGMTNGTTYYVAIRAVDATGNLGVLAVPQSSTAQLTYGLAESKGDSGGCAATGHGTSPWGSASVILFGAAVLAAMRKYLQYRRKRA